VFDAEDRFWSQYQSEKDEKAFGAQWASFVRASVFPTLAATLDSGLGDARTGQFLDQLEAGVAARLAAAPEQMQIPLAHLVLIKRPKAR
jgi:salicylate 1-O-methyltransferase